MNPYFMAAFQDELEKIAQARQEVLHQEMHPAMMAAFQDELEKIAVARGTILSLGRTVAKNPFRMSGTAARKALDTTAKTPVGRTALLDALPKLNPKTPRTSLTEGQKVIRDAYVGGLKSQKPLTSKDLSNVIIDGVPVPREALKGMSAAEIRQLTTLGAPAPAARRTASDVYRASQQASDRVMVAASRPGPQGVLTNITTGGPITDVGDAAATLVPEVMAAARKMKLPKPPRLPRPGNRPPNPVPVPAY